MWLEPIHCSLRGPVSIRALLPMIWFGLRDDPPLLTRSADEDQPIVDATVNSHHCAKALATLRQLEPIRAAFGGMKRLVFLGHAIVLSVGKGRASRAVARAVFPGEAVGVIRDL